MKKAILIAAVAAFALVAQVQALSGPGRFIYRMVDGRKARP